jgi:hypothetical protein
MLVVFHDGVWFVVSGLSRALRLSRFTPVASFSKNFESDSRSALGGLVYHLFLLRHFTAFHFLGEPVWSSASWVNLQNWRLVYRAECTRTMVLDFENP